MLSYDPTIHLLSFRPTPENLAEFDQALSLLSPDERDLALRRALSLTTTFSRPPWTAHELDAILTAPLPSAQQLALNQHHRFRRRRLDSDGVERLLAEGPTWAIFAAGAQTLTNAQLARFLTTPGLAFVPDDIMRAQATSAPRLLTIARSGFVPDLSTPEWLDLITRYITTLEQLSELLPRLDAIATAAVLLRPRSARYPLIPRALIASCVERHPDLGTAIYIRCSSSIRNFNLLSMTTSPRRPARPTTRLVDRRRLILHVPGLAPLLRAAPPTDAPVLAKPFSELLRRCPDTASVLSLAANPGATLAQAIQSAHALAGVA